MAVKGNIPGGKTAQRVGDAASHLVSSGGTPLPTLTPSGPGLVQQVDAKANSLFFAPMVAGIFAGPAAWMAHKGKSNGLLAKPFAWGAKVLGTPQNIMETGAGKLGHVASGAMHKAAEITGSEKLGRTGQRLAQGERNLFVRSSVTLGHMGEWAERQVRTLDGMTGGFIGKKRAARVERYTNAATAMREAAGQSHAAALTQLDTIGASLPKGGVYEPLHNLLSATKDKIGGAITAADPALLKEQASFLRAQKAAVKATANKILKSGSLITPDELNMLGQKFTGKELTQAITSREKELSNLLSSVKGGGFLKKNGGFTAFADTALSHGKQVAAAQEAAFSAGLNSSLSNLKHLPERISKMQTSEALNHGIYYVSQAASAYRTATAFTSRMKTIEHMYTSITGEKASAYKMLFGKLPESMKEIRGQYFRAAIPEALSNITGMAVFRQMMKGGGSGKAMLMGVGVQMAMSAAGKAISPANDLIKTYEQITQAREQGVKDVPKAAFAALIVAAKPSLRNLDVSDPALLKVADHYSKSGASAGAVLKDIDSHKVDDLLKEARAELPKATASGAAPLEAKPVLGAHTGKVAAQRMNTPVAGTAASLA